MLEAARILFLITTFESVIANLLYIRRASSCLLCYASLKVCTCYFLRKRVVVSEICSCCCPWKVREAVIDAKEELRQRSQGGGDVFRREDGAMTFSMVRDKQFRNIQPEPPHRRYCRYV